MNRPSSAFGLLLGFLALTMFAVSSTSRSTTVKPAASYLDRAAIRRQAAQSRLTAVAAADTVENESLCNDAVCVARAADADQPLVACTGAESEPLALLKGQTARLTSVHVEAAVSESAAVAETDDRTYYDVEYDRVVLGVSDAKTQTAPTEPRQDNSELSVVDVATLFHSLMSEKTAAARNATKPQRRASLEGFHSQTDTFTRSL